MAKDTMGALKCPSCYASAEGNAYRCEYCGTYFNNKFAGVVPYGVSNADLHPFQLDLQLNQEFVAETPGKYYINGGVSSRNPDKKYELWLNEGDAVALTPTQPKEPGRFETWLTQNLYRLVSVVLKDA